MPSLRLKRPSTLPNPHLPWSKQNLYTRWYFRNYKFANFIEDPLMSIFDPEKAKTIFKEATEIYNILSSFYHNHYPEKKFYNTVYIYHQIIKMLQSYGTISALDSINIIYGTPGMRSKQDNRTLKRWAKEYEDSILSNLDRLKVENDSPLVNYFVIAPPGINLIKKTD